MRRSLYIAVFILSVLNAHIAVASVASSPQEAAQIARQQAGADSRVLDVATETTTSGERVFVVKVIRHGRVQVIRIEQR